jgi:NAD(P)-dependent dehydrogenase (short-subunit alcohol dehydrogenase family)
MMRDKFILITGATGGLGVEVVKQVLTYYPRLVTIPYHDLQSLSYLEQKLSPQAFEFLNLVTCDVSQEKQVQFLINQMPQVDVLIHLVGGFDMGDTDQYSFDAWQRMFDLNLNTTFLMAKYCLQRMKETGYGRIVAVASRGAVQPAGQLAAYGASKAGVCNLMAAIAEETKLKYFDITANTVLPSIIDTPKNREVMGSENVWSWVSPESLAKVICFLASEDARDIRGANIPVYGKA